MICYHRACDTVENISREVLEQNTRSRARASRGDRVAEAQHLFRRQSTCRVKQ
jgi:hypothetical protein